MGASEKPVLTVKEERSGFESQIKSEFCKWHGHLRDPETISWAKGLETAIEEKSWHKVFGLTKRQHDKGLQAMHSIAINLINLPKSEPLPTMPPATLSARPRQTVLFPIATQSAPP